jgi:hypothetical protein
MLDVLYHASGVPLEFNSCLYQRRIPLHHLRVILILIRLLYEVAGIVDPRSADIATGAFEGMRTHVHLLVVLNSNCIFYFLHYRLQRHGFEATQHHVEQLNVPSKVAHRRVHVDRSRDVQVLDLDHLPHPLVVVLLLLIVAVDGTVVVPNYRCIITRLNHTIGKINYLSKKNKLIN